MGWYAYGAVGWAAGGSTSGVVMKLGRDGSGGCAAEETSAVGAGAEPHDAGAGAEGVDDAAQVGGSAAEPHVGGAAGVAATGG